MKARGRAPLICLALAAGAPAHAAETRLSADVGAGVGYSKNPFSDLDARGSLFYDLTATGRVNVVTALSVLTAEARVNVQDFIRQYSNSDAYGASLAYQTRATERLTLDARLDYDDSVIGSNNGSFGGIDPGTIDPTGPDGVNLGLFGSRARRRQFVASGSANWGFTARDTLQASASYSQGRYSGAQQLGNYDGVSGTLGYQRRLNEQLSVGLTGTASRYDYATSGNSSVYAVQGTVDWTIDPRWTLRGAAGVSFISGGVGGGGSRRTVSGNLDLCRKGARDQLCVRVDRQVSPTGFAGVQTNTTGSVSYSRQLSERDTVTASASYASNAGDNVSLGANDRYLTGNIGYSRTVTERLRLVSNAFYRKVDGGTLGIGADYGGRIGIEYRLGDLR